MSLQESATNIAEYSVSELSSSLKRTIEDSYGYVRLRGEISGYRGPHSSGHAYFALKDASAKIEAVIWRGSMGKLKFKPEEGLEVIATGKVTTYPGSSKYQIVIERMEPAGAGALMALLEERRRKFAAEGLFADARKRALPHLPLTIGIITSPTGAVIRDMLHRIADRFPLRVIVWPVRVQGETSAEEVATAIEGFNTPSVHFQKPDLIIVARGGGSLEDLWGFNEERVVRAAAQSAIPLISAIGHETDWTLLDHVADLRAPTPTASVELALRVRSDLLAQLGELGARNMRAVRNITQRSVKNLEASLRALPRLDTLLAMPRQRVDHTNEKLTRAAFTAFQHKRSKLGKSAQGLSVPLLAQRLQRMRERAQTLSTRCARALSVRDKRKEFATLARRLSPAPLIQKRQQQSQRLRDFHDRLQNAYSSQLKQQKRALASKTQLLSSLSYRSVLARGFAVVRQDETIVMRANDYDKGKSLSIEFSDGRVEIGDNATGSDDLFSHAKGQK